MELIRPLLGLLTEVGKIINFENAQSLSERVETLRKVYDHEISKGPLRDDALIYTIRLELRDICELYCASLKGQAAQG